MYLNGNVHIENFEKISSKFFTANERYDDPSCGVVLTFISLKNSAGSVQSSIKQMPAINGQLRDDANALILGDHSEVRVQFKNSKGQPVLVHNVKYQWATHPDYTAEDARQDAIDAKANNIVFADPIRMELRREGKAYFFNQFEVPGNAPAVVDLKNIMLDEILFTTSRRGKVYFDNFNWEIV